MDPTNTNTALASVFAEELARCGLKRAVVSPGSRSTPLAVALFRHPEIEVDVVLDERSAGFFALGSALSSASPVALLCTSGTAAANYHPAVAEADLSSVPLIVLTADRPPELRDNGSGQAIDQIKLFGDAVRWFSEVGSHLADDSGLLHMRATACRAWAGSTGEPRPGPVHLNFPLRDPLDPSPVEGAVTARDPLAVGGRRGAPLTEVTRSGPSLDPEQFERIVGVVESAERPMIVVGRQYDTGLRQPVAGLARRLGCPILAEPTSQLRLGPHDRGSVIARYDRIATILLDKQAKGPDRGGPASTLTPDLVLRLGETPTSKNLRVWLAGLRGTRQIVIDRSYGWYEPSRIADLIVRAEPVTLLTGIEQRLGTGSIAADHGFRDAWLAAEADAGGDRAAGGDELTPRRIHEEIADCYRDGDLVFTASSMAIRDQESFLPPGPADVLFLSNRGANGIDGTLASGAGAAVAAGRPTTVITGELAFQHDLGSLALVAASPVAVRVVVVNDGGGRIFSRLPQKHSLTAEEFETLMNSPGSLDMAAASAMFGIPHFAVSGAGDLAEALKTPGTCVIEIALRPD